MIDRRFEYIRNQIIDEMIMEQQKLEEMENHKSPIEEAFKRIYGYYPGVCERSVWIAFQKGYEAHQSLVDDANKIKSVASMTNCIIEGNPPNGCSAWNEWFELFGSKGILHNLRISAKEYQSTSQELEMTLEKSGEFSIVSYNGETYYRNLYDGICGGWYKTDTDGEVFYLVEDETERKLEKLYQEQVVVKEPKKEQKWDVVRESVKWCKEHPDESVEDYLKPHTPEKTEQLLREAFKKVQQTEEWKETQRKIDSNYDDMVKNPPEFLKFELGKTLEALITRWWCDVFTTHEDWDMETAIDDLCDRVELWLPKSQSHEGTQSASVIDLVDGYNDALTKIKSKLRKWYYTHNAVQSGDVIANEIVNVVKEWIKTHHREETKYDADYNAGWNDCLDELKGKLR